MIKRKLNATEVAVLVGCSIPTLNYWYAFKRQNPENEFAKMLPDFIQSSARQTRYWNEEDIFKIVKFKNSLPKGCNGVLGSVTQKYVKKKG
jgi:hypothetical protein